MIYQIVRGQCFECKKEVGLSKVVLAFFQFDLENYEALSFHEECLERKTYSDFEIEFFTKEFLGENSLDDFYTVGHGSSTYYFRKGKLISKNEFLSYLFSLKIT